MIEAESAQQPSQCFEMYQSELNAVIIASSESQRLIDFSEYVYIWFHVQLEIVSYKNALEIVS